MTRVSVLTDKPLVNDLIMRFHQLRFGRFGEGLLVKSRFFNNCGAMGGTSEYLFGHAARIEKQIVSASRP